MTPGMPQPIQALAKGPVMIKWRVACCRTGEPLSDPMFSKNHAESLAAKQTRKGRSAVVEKVEA